MTRKNPPKIDQTLKNLVENTSKDSSPTSSSTDLKLARLHDLPGDPACPKCHGVGYLRKDLPVGHPDFGKLQVCDCRTSQVSQQVRQRLFALSRLDELSHLTFENFQPRGRVGLLPRQAVSLEQTFNHAQRFAQLLEGWLVLQGGFGCGKTHLAAAIANFAVSVGIPTLFITVPDLLDTLRFAYNDPGTTFEERFEQIRSAPLLVMDDFGTQNATPWAQEKLFQIINYRYINRLPLVVTTNVDVEDFEERIRSRIQDPDLVTLIRILSPDYRNPTRDFGDPDMSTLGLLHDRTFVNFYLRKNEGINSDELHSLEEALDAALKFAENPIGWLVFTGSYGCGKTHLAAAIGNFRQDHGQPVTFTVVPDLLDHLRATFNPSSTITLDRRFEKVRTAQLLILDDLGTQVTSPWAKEKLYQLLNHRYNAALPTVITTSSKIEDIDPRLRSRMIDTRLCKIYGIIAPPFTGKSIVKAKSRYKSTARKASG